MRGVKCSYEKAINAVKTINFDNISVGISFSPNFLQYIEFPKVVENFNEISNLHSIRAQSLMSLDRAYLNSIHLQKISIESL